MSIPSEGGETFGMTMGRHAVRGVAGALALLALAACDDGDAPGLGDGTVTNGTAFAEMQSRLEALPESPFDAGSNVIPVTGTAVYEGFMNVNVTGASDPFELTGTTRITADFAASTLTGEATDFELRRGTLLSSASGTVTFQDGRIGQTGTPLTGDPNDVRLGYVGTVTAPGNVVVLNGEATGAFRGAPIQGLLAESADGETVRLNGTDVAADVTIAAEN
jgi:hypothetical protein